MANYAGEAADWIGSERKKKWKGDHRCCLCGADEDVDHILFQCLRARFTWACLSEALGWRGTPASMQEFLEHWIPLGGEDSYLKLFMFVVVFWVLWTTRNKQARGGGRVFT